MKRPSAFVVNVEVAPVAVSRIVTVAPATAAPVESVTVPLMPPVTVDWANAFGCEV